MSAQKEVYKLYLSGPMSGLPDNNYPAFLRLEEALKQFPQLEVMNPARNLKPTDPSWVNWMRLSLKQVAEADAIILMKGWTESKGANAELKVARYLELPVLYQAYELEP